MKILVTGGTGFIGSHLVDELVKRHDVTVFGHDKNKAWLNPKAHFIKGDILDAEAIKSAMEGCEAVFHLAALTDVRKSEQDPDYDYDINFVGSKNVFEIAAKEGCKVIFTSSAAVYGNAEPPIGEDAELNPISNYGRHKSMAEKAAPPGSAVFRLFNVYGPRGNSAINRFCGRIMDGQEITIYGTGLQTRDFVFVNDVVRALVMGLSASGTYNVGTGKEATILSIVHTIEKLSGKTAPIKFEKGSKAEIARSSANISKLRATGWKPELSIKEGIRKTLDSLK